MSFLLSLMCAGWLGYLIVCGNTNPAMYGSCGLAILMVAAQLMEDSR